MAVNLKYYDENGNPFYLTRDDIMSVLDPYEMFSTSSLNVSNGDLGFYGIKL